MVDAARQQRIVRRLAWGIAAGLFLLSVELGIRLALALKPRQDLRVFAAVLDGSGAVLRLRPNYRQRWKTPEWDVTVAIDGRGFRGTDAPALEEADVVLLGDSFTFGHGVGDEQRFSAVLAQRRPDLKVLNLSYANGFQPEHYEYYLHRQPTLRPRYVLVMLYLGNDLYADVRETELVRGADGRIEHLGLPWRDTYFGALILRDTYRIPGLHQAAKYSAAVRFGLRHAHRIGLRDYLIVPTALYIDAPNPPALERGQLGTEAARALLALERIDAWARQRAARLEVLLIPQNYLLGAGREPHIDRGLLGEVPRLRAEAPLLQALLGECARRGLTCLDLRPLLSAADYYPDDAHWTAGGHAAIGVWLAEHLPPAAGDRAFAR